MIVRRLQQQFEGFILPGVLAFILAAGIIGTALLMVILNNFFVVSNNVQSQQSFNIAEAGLNYYLWHMSHNGTDYKDGNSTPTTPDATLGYGPYTHTYLDSNAKNAGTYTLWIKPQGNGSTIATVRSIGKAAGSTMSRTVQAQIGAASFASYGLVADTEFWFGSNETANGPIFSNVGVHMDGANSDVVSSANSSYTPQGIYGGDGSAHAGVWCSTSVTSPNCNTRDKSNWLYPKPAVDFNLVAGSLCTMKKTALKDYAATLADGTASDACSRTPTARTNSYIPQYSASGTFSSTQGYLIQLNTNGTYDLYKVSGENDKNTPYTAALSTTLVAAGITPPPSGVLFVEDNVWVRTNPSYHGRMSIASGRLAATTASKYASITIADNLLYSAKDGSDALGLISQKDILVAPYAPPTSGSFNFEIDAATLAQTGSVTWPRYYDGTTNCTRGWTGSTQKFIYYGSIATRLDWTWNYSQSGGACGNMVKDTTTANTYYSGVEHTDTNYDYNLLYAPPPSYPVTGSYNILSWREVLTKP